MFHTPVLFLVFNRLDTTMQVFEQIKVIKPKYLFIAADGPRENIPGEKEKCEEVRKYVLDSIDWQCEVKTLFRNENLGCKYAVSSAIKWFFQNVEMGIVLEDDCLPSKSFFNYCETLLESYKDDENIGMISGHNYFGKTDEKKHDYSLITTCGVWGWASWRRVISDYNPDYSKLIDHSLENIKTICVRKATGEKLLKNSYEAVLNKINTWDYQFCEYLIVNNMFTIMPNINLIRNIGFIKTSTHTIEPPSWYKDVSYDYDCKIKIEKKIKLDVRISKKIELFHTGKNQNIIYKILNKSKKILSQNINLVKVFVLFFLRYLDSSLGEKLRYKYYKRNLKYIGKNVKIDTGVFIYGMEYVSIDDNSHIDKNCIIVGSSSKLDLSQRAVKIKENSTTLVDKGEIFIGKECHISQYCMIYGYGGVYIGDNCVMSTGSKVYSLTSMPTNPFDEAEIISIVPYEGISPTLLGKVVLNDNVWIGINSVISPGVIIGRNSFVRSNSIVLNSFDENSYIAGDPAIFIRNRFKSK